MKNLFLLTLLTFLLLSCSGDDSVSTDTSNEESTKVVIVPKYGSDELFDSNSIKINQSGNEYSISQLKFFISNIRLTSLDNKEYSFDNIYYYDINVPSFIDLKADIDEYKKLSFYVGLDSATNHGDPALQDSESILNPSNTDMHWNWMSGYIFCSIEGYLHENGDVSNAFSYHIGGMDKLMKVELDLINLNSSYGIELNFDISKIFDNKNNIDISQQTVTHSSNDNGLSLRLSENISEAFSIE